MICNVTAAVGGAGKITASAIGATKDFDLMVNTTILRFITPPPAAVTEIPIGTNRTVTVEYISGTTPQADVVVNFVTTRGALSASSATTGPDGRATVTVSSRNSGPASLVASVAAGPTSQAGVEFVSTSVSSLTLQASPATIGTNSGGLETERSLITATVRDANNNLVKNKTVTFTIVSDVSGGRLTPASAITDSFGIGRRLFHRRRLVRRSGRRHHPGGGRRHLGHGNDDAHRRKEGPVCFPGHRSDDHEGRSEQVPEGLRRPGDRFGR